MTVSPPSSAALREPRSGRRLLKTFPATSGPMGVRPPRRRDGLGESASAVSSATRNTPHRPRRRRFRARFSAFARAHPPHRSAAGQVRRRDIENLRSAPPRAARRTHGAHAANLRSLLSSYGVAHTRREFRMRDGSSFYASSVVSSSSTSSNSLSLSKTFPSSWGHDRIFPRSYVKVTELTRRQ